MDNVINNIGPKSIEAFEKEQTQGQGLIDAIKAVLDKKDIDKRALVSLFNTLELHRGFKKNDYQSAMDKVNTGFMQGSPPVIIERSENITIFVTQPLK